MHPITLADLVYAFRNLSEIKKPSKQIKQALERLETNIYIHVMGLRIVDSVPRPETLTETK